MGPVIASPLAIYMVKNSRPSRHIQGGGGLIGALIVALVAAALSKVFSKEDGIVTCTNEDLPPAVKLFLYPKGKMATKNVVVIPRTTVSFVKTSKWNNAITFTAGTDAFIANTSLLMMWRRQRQMAEFGWPLNQTIIPEAEAVHDTRPPELRPVKNPSRMWRTIGIAVLAVLILAIVVMVVAFF